MTDAPIDDEIRRILTIWDHQNGTEIVKARQIFRLGHTATEKDVKKAWKQLSLFASCVFSRCFRRWLLMEQTADVLLTTTACLWMPSTVVVRRDGAQASQRILSGGTCSC